MSDWTVKVANWDNADDQAAIRHIRETVFIKEQSVPGELEWDGLDPDCLQLLAVDFEDGPIATARMCVEDGIAHIGRMCVLKAWREKGVGTALINTLIAHTIDSPVGDIVLNAQTSALGFYTRHRFITIGDEFMDAGIPHFHMLYNG